MPPRRREDAKERIVIGNALEYDYGVAPNTSGGLWTNALCRPDMRRSVRIGDIVIGFVTHNMATETKDTENPVKQGGIAYFAKITSIFSHKQYNDILSHNAELQKLKTPHYTDTNEFTKSMLEDETNTNLIGDNIFDCPVYCHAAEGLEEYVQEDYESPFVLCSEDFFYFGNQSWGLDHLKDPNDKLWFEKFVIPLNKNGPGYKKTYFESEVVADEFFDRLKVISRKACQLPVDHPGGVVGRPTMDLKQKIIDSTKHPMAKTDIEKIQQEASVKDLIPRAPIRPGASVLTKEGVIKAPRGKKPLEPNEIEDLDEALGNIKKKNVDQPIKDEAQSTSEVHHSTKPRVL